MPKGLISQQSRRDAVAMHRAKPQSIDPTDQPAQYALPLEPLTVRIPVAVRLTGIGRSKLYELIKAGELQTVKIGTATLVTMTSLRKLIERGSA